MQWYGKGKNRRAEQKTKTKLYQKYAKISSILMTILSPASQYGLSQWLPALEEPRVGRR
jgi:hypothetical protein